MRAAVAALLVLLAASGCEFSSVPSADLGGSGAPAATASGTPDESSTPRAVSATPSREVFLAEAAAGSWRPAALPLTPGFLDEFEARCVGAEPALSELPVAVREARGASLISVIFGDAAAGDASYLCRGRIGAVTSEDLDVVALEDPAEPIGDEALDLLRWESLSDDEGDTRLVAVGRAGPLVDRVVAGFPDESEVEAAKGGGWWVMWWPGSETTITIAALNRQSLAIDSLAPDSPPEPG